MGWGGGRGFDRLSPRKHADAEPVEALACFRHGKIVGPAEKKKQRSWAGFPDCEPGMTRNPAPDYQKDS
jgi:hypothetical protein